MVWLVAASSIWAFSFGLIKQNLAGFDPWFISSARLLLAAAVFLPWTLARAPAAGLRWRAMALGMLQFGAMYVLYLTAFSSLAAWQVAIWTLLTPVYVALLGILRERAGAWRPLAAALIAVAGALLAEGRWPQGASLHGVLLVQGSNLCFAAGQLWFRPLVARAAAVAGRPPDEAGLLGWMYLGAVLLVVIGWIAFGDRQAAIPSGPALGVLAYLGVVATGLAFWLWNKGAARVSPGRLAVANNLKVPLAVLAAWLVFQEAAPYLRATAGLAVIMGALRLAAVRKGPIDEMGPRT